MNFASFVFKPVYEAIHTTTQISLFANKMHYNACASQTDKQAVFRKSLNFNISIIFTSNELALIKIPTVLFVYSFSDSLHYYISCPDSGSFYYMTTSSIIGVLDDRRTQILTLNKKIIQILFDDHMTILNT